MIGSELTTVISDDVEIKVLMCFRGNVAVASSCNCAISSQLNYGVSTYSADSIKHPIANFSLLKNLISIPYIAIILKSKTYSGM